MGQRIDWKVVISLDNKKGIEALAEQYHMTVSDIINIAIGDLLYVMKTGEHGQELVDKETPLKFKS